jgi:hypothetical protein
VAVFSFGDNEMPIRETFRHAPGCHGAASSLDNMLPVRDSYTWISIGC